MLSTDGLYCDQCECLPDMLVTFYAAPHLHYAYYLEERKKWVSSNRAGWWEFCYYCALTFVPPSEYLINSIEVSYQKEPS